MSFNSLTYIVFLFLSVIIYWSLKHGNRKYLIFVASLAFYSFWRWEYTFVLLFSASVDYFSSIRIGLTNDKNVKKIWLAICIFIDFGLLAYFKYTNFAFENAYSILSLIGCKEIQFIPFNILLPLGISFYTFQSISYTIDVYRGIQKPIANFITFINYVMLWPQLVAGPILRASEIIPFLVEMQKFRLWQFKYGLERILIGLFKKVVLADSISTWVDGGFASNPALLSTIDSWTLSLAFGFQIYFDFSGYSDIAIGSANLLGLKFPENFNFPYFSTSPREFWKKWHISLSSWIRDYLYIPIMGQQFTFTHSTATGGLEIEQKRSNKKKSAALFITWSIMGLWHGANWTFIVWGLWHALFIYLYRKLNPFFNLIPNLPLKFFGWLLTLGIVLIGWIFFRSENLNQAFALVQTMVVPWKFKFFLGLRETLYLIVAVYFIGMCVTFFITSLKVRDKSRLVYKIGKFAFYSFILAYVILEFRPVKQFIYFQF